MLFLPDGRGTHRGRNGEGKRKQIHQPLLRSQLRRSRGEHQQRKQNHLLRKSGHQSRRGNHLRLQIPIRRQGTGVSVWSEKLCGENELSYFCYYVEGCLLHSLVTFYIDFLFLTKTLNLCPELVSRDQ